MTIWLKTATSLPNILSFPPFQVRRIFSLSTVPASQKPTRACVSNFHSNKFLVSYRHSHPNQKYLNKSPDPRLGRVSIRAVLYCLITPFIQRRVKFFLVPRNLSSQKVNKKGRRT
jgi:hypothetical protein